MLIDWFTVGAQAVNFLILVWLLKRFLYQPVLAAIDAREKKVAAELQNAAAAERRARQEGDDFQQRNAALEEQRAQLLRQAVEDANVERQRLLEEARQESQALRSKLAAAFTQDRAELNRQIATRTQKEVFALARKTLADLADRNLEDRMTEVFIDRLRTLPLPTLPEGQRSELGEPARVRSAFELAPAARAAIEAAVRDYLKASLEVSFETAPDIICGIELIVDGQRLSWSVEDHLASLNDDVTSLLERGAAVASDPATGAQHAA